MVRRKSVHATRERKKRKSIASHENRKIIREAREKLKGFSGRRIVLKCVKCGCNAITVDNNERNKDLYRRQEMIDNILCICCRPPNVSMKDVLRRKGIEPWW